MHLWDQHLGEDAAHLIVLTLHFDSGESGWVFVLGTSCLTCGPRALAGRVLFLLKLRVQSFPTSLVCVSVPEAAGFVLKYLFYLIYFFF